MRNSIVTAAMAAILFAVSLSTTAALQAGPVQVSSGIKYEFLARWDVDRLNKILQSDIPKFAGLHVN